MEKLNLIISILASTVTIISFLLSIPNAGSAPDSAVLIISRYSNSLRLVMMTIVISLLYYGLALTQGYIIKFLKTIFHPLSIPLLLIISSITAWSTLFLIDLLIIAGNSYSTLQILLIRIGSCLILYTFNLITGLLAMWHILKQVEDFDEEIAGVGMVITQLLNVAAIILMNIVF